MKKIKFLAFHFFILLILFFIILETHVYNTFGSIDLRQIIYHIDIPVGKTNGNFVSNGINYIMPRYLIVLVFYFTGLYIFSKIDITYTFNFFKKIKKININNFFKKKRWILLLIIFLGNILLLNRYFYIFHSIKNMFINTEIYEEHYVNPNEVNITMPEIKRNLIYIYVESLETADLSKAYGGYRNESIIPEIERLAKENLNFSQNNNLGGFYQTVGTAYTVGAIIGQTAGLPLITISNQDRNKQNLYDNVLTNAYTLGQILEKEGYKNYFMMGSDKYFADRGGYLLTHGQYNIFDYDSAIIKHYIPEGYDIDWWGFEDKKLYEYAKLRLEEIANNDKPFNFSLLTVDTHPTEGYLDETCDVDLSLTKYENVFKCGSTMLNDFIKWIQKQSFYKNTTVIITGDHLNMVEYNIHDNMPSDYDRTVLNIFMNSAITTDCNKNRLITTYDMYPTTLAAIGAKIEGEKLGLGTNLFSCQNTLSEELGLDYLLTEIGKNSSYYRKCLLHNQC